MKLFFMSDIHGSLHYLKKGLESFEKEGADYICILGDELYHGARNPLPEGYNTIEAAQLLNKYAEKIIAVRGNCDSEIDALVLDYPMMSDYTVVLNGSRRVFMSHGHIYGEHNLPKLNDGDIFVFGHIHLPVAEKRGNIYIFNPGSIALPKENNPNSYGVLEGKTLSIKALDGAIIRELALE